jgi:hypothetical protein
MSDIPKILPVHGEGNHAVVEGASHHFNIEDLRQAPSVNALRCHLPINGEDLL